MAVCLPASATAPSHVSEMLCAAASPESQAVGEPHVGHPTPSGKMWEPSITFQMPFVSAALQGLMAFHFPLPYHKAQ